MSNLTIKKVKSTLYAVSSTDTVIRISGIRGLHFSPPYKKFCRQHFDSGGRTIFTAPKAYMLLAYNAFAAHSDI